MTIFETIFCQEITCTIFVYLLHRALDSNVVFCIYSWWFFLIFTILINIFELLIEPFRIAEYISYIILFFYENMVFVF